MLNQIAFLWKLNKSSDFINSRISFFDHTPAPHDYSGCDLVWAATVQRFRIPWKVGLAQAPGTCPVQTLS